MSEHSEAHAAILAYLTRAPRPTIRLPVSGWGAALSGGSANIPLMFVAAGYGYGLPDARKRVLELGEISRRRYMMAEPYGAVYSDWHVLCWALIEHVAEERDDQEVLAAVGPMLDQWFGLAALMSAKCPTANLHDDERKHAGKTILALAGCRSWGHGHGLGFGQHTTWRCALNEEQPRGDSWLEQMRFRVMPALRERARRFRAMSPAQIVAAIPQYNARIDFRFLLYADGSRVCLMGHDAADHQSDPNNNTLGFCAFVVDRGRNRVASYPEWPAPNTGDERIRQQAAKATLRPNGTDGWILHHALVGRYRDGAGWVTEISEPTAPMVGAWMAPANSGAWVDLLAVGSDDDTEEVIFTPPDPVPAKPKPSWIERMGL
jgi:hypothetical protein